MWLVFTAAINAGVMMFCWWGLERVFVRDYFLSNLIGDSLGLTLVAFGEAWVIRKLPDCTLDRWYTNRWFYVVLLAVLAVGWYWFTFHDPDVNRAQRLSPASLWHTAMWPYFAFMPLAIAIPVLSNAWRAPGFVVIALIGLAIWGATLYRDMTTHPPPLGASMEFQWGKWLRHPLWGQPPVRIRVDQYRRSGKALPGWFHERWRTDGAPK